MSFVSAYDVLAKGENEWEDIEGSFLCHAKDCWKVSHEAQYSERDEVVKWTCPVGHVNEAGMKL